ncbi:hypothetical protein KMP13_04710 [Epibacterium ulvae]|uniref:hypothetical protein n=1 Tax=Epibacterium ulvae TaxID=1156985 RepID=UPI001BFCB85C|nr:hypothetical protein [Epibacterium ulvae]MBT8153200.1 hypothetical protein [Epibacterium ulvae]
MKRLNAFAFAATLTAGPALAHGGAHIHPHGAETWIAAAIAAGIAAIAASYLWGRK